MPRKLGIFAAWQTHHCQAGDLHTRGEGPSANAERQSQAARWRASDDGDDAIVVNNKAL